MPEKIDLTKEVTENDRHIVSHALIEALTHALPGQKFEEFVRARAPGRKDHVVVDVALVVDGMEVPFRKVMEGWQAQIDRMVEARARALLKEKASDIYGRLCDIEMKVEEFANDLFPRD